MKTYSREQIAEEASYKDSAKIIKEQKSLQKSHKKKYNGLGSYLNTI
jgi:hypothetical protein